MSAKAVKISTLRLPGLIGLGDLVSHVSLQVLELGVVCSGVTLSIDAEQGVDEREVVARSCFQDGRSMSARLIWTLPPTAASSGIGTSSSSGVAVLKATSTSKSRWSDVRRSRSRRSGQRAVDGCSQLGEREAERLDRAFQALEQVDRHQRLQARSRSTLPSLPRCRLRPRCRTAPRTSRGGWAGCS